MEEISYREMRPQDVPTTLALRNEVFADHPVTATDWAHDGMLAAIALIGGEVVGAVPLVPRELVITPGVTITAPLENSVGTRAALRGRGLGAGMIDAARQFMHDRADGLFVYRDDERSDGYRFYVKTGHFPLMATHTYRLTTTGADWVPTSTVTVGVDAITSRSVELLPLFHSTYGAYGGFPPRTQAYWQRALRSSIYAEIPTEFALTQVWHGKALAGYAIIGWHTRKPDGFVHIMEMAVRGLDLALAQQTLMTVGAFANEHGLHVRIDVSDADPFLAALQSVGFVANKRDMFLMGQIIDVQSFFQRSWADRIELDGTGLRVSTPRAEYTLIEAASGFPTLTLEMAEETLHRWLLCRVDLAARLREGTVTTYGGHAASLHHLCAAIPLTSWAYHSLDWI